MKPIATWEHAGLMVSAAPLAWVVMAPTGLHGVHRVTVAAESAAAAKQLLAKLIAGRPEARHLRGLLRGSGDSTRRSATWQAANRPTAGATASQAVFIPNIDEKYLEDRVRARTRKWSSGRRRRRDNMTSASVWTRVTARSRSTGSELAGYARATGKYEAERALGQSALPDPKPPPQPERPLTARTKLPAAETGRLSRPAGGRRRRRAGCPKIDERTYWFDGKTFEEL